MLKRLQSTLTSFSFIETILICGLASVWIAYFFYFIIIPQYWTLRDDYRFIVEWGQPGSDQFDLGLQYLKGNVKYGRFQPVDVLSRIIHYRYLPISPRVFHATFFATALAALAALASFLHSMKRSRQQILFALLLVSSNLAMKEWLTTLTVSESSATLFLFLAMALYARGRCNLAIVAFALSFLSKESFVGFSPVFLVLDWSRTGRLWPRKQSLAILMGSFAFSLWILSLPRVYAQGLSLSKVGLIPLALTLFVPALKSFGPALFVPLASLKRDLGAFDRALILIGLWIIGFYTILMNAWGPFESWFYLHEAIPFGWALLLSALWNPAAPKLSDFALIAASFGFFVLITLNGGRNTTLFGEYAKKMALLSCRDANAAGLNFIYNNCYEGSSQLRHALTLELGNNNSGCHLIPEFRRIEAEKPLPEDGKRPWMFLYNSKCDVFPLDSIPKDAASFELGTWTLFRYQPK